MSIALAAITNSMSPFNCLTNHDWRKLPFASRGNVRSHLRPSNRFAGPSLSALLASGDRLSQQEKHQEQLEYSRSAISFELGPTLSPSALLAVEDPSISPTAQQC
jgi:hypothetical protein